MGFQPHFCLDFPLRPLIPISSTAGGSRMAYLARYVAKDEVKDLSNQGAGMDLFAEDSGIHGLGVYTRKPIAKGALVIQCLGIVRHRDEIYEGLRALQIGPETYLAEDPANPRLDDFINHSCDPNVGFAQGSLTLYALRDIQAGDELFWDYRTSINEAGWEVPCTCGAAHCRGKIQSYCDLPGEERARLRAIALEYLR
jgi:hypothetical protein